MDHETIARLVFDGITGVAVNAKRPKHVAESILATVQKIVNFETPPISWHVGEIAKIIIDRTMLAPAHVEAYPLIQIDYTVSDCICARWPIEHVHSRLRKDILRIVIFFGCDRSIQRAAKHIDEHCSVTWNPPAAPFVDGPVCRCKNCRITNG